jgi:hypothetical protein
MTYACCGRPTVRLYVLSDFIQTSAVDLAAGRSCWQHGVGARSAREPFLLHSMSGKGKGGRGRKRYRNDDEDFYIDDGLLAELGGLSTKALMDALQVMGWPTGFIEGARPLAPDQDCAGRAVTLRMVSDRVATSHPTAYAEAPSCTGTTAPRYRRRQTRWRRFS